MKRQPVSNKRLFLLNFIASVLSMIVVIDSGDTVDQSGRVGAVLKTKIRYYFPVFLFPSTEEYLLEECVRRSPGWLAVLSISIYQ